MLDWLIFLFGNLDLYLLHLEWQKKKKEKRVRVNTLILFQLLEHVYPCFAQSTLNLGNAIY